VIELRKMPQEASERKQGGSGYRGLRDRLAAEVADPQLEWWFIADPPSKLISLVTGLAVASILAGKTVVGLAGQQVVIIPAGKLARADSLDIDGTIQVPLEEAHVSFDPKKERVTVAGEPFGIVMGYEYEAVQFAGHAGAAMPDWFVRA
jgi:hypothetical protein